MISSTTSVFAKSDKTKPNHRFEAKRMLVCPRTCGAMPLQTTCVSFLRCRLCVYPSLVISCQESAPLPSVDPSMLKAGRPGCLSPLTCLKSQGRHLIPLPPPPPPPLPTHHFKKIIIIRRLFLLLLFSLFVFVSFFSILKLALSFFVPCIFLQTIHFPDFFQTFLPYRSSRRKK